MITPISKTVIRNACFILLFLLLGVVIIKANYNAANNFFYPSKFIEALMLQVLIFIQIFLLLYIFTVKINKKKLKQVGLLYDTDSLSLFIKGFAIAGVGAIIAWFASLYIHGINYAIDFENFRTADFIFWGLGSLFQVSYEELLFRTWALVAIVELVGAKKAICIVGLFFGLAHLLNPSLSLLGILNGVLVGVIFSLAFIESCSVWLPIGLHFGWNFCKEILTSSLLGKTSGGAVPNIESTVATTISTFLMGILVWYVTSKAHRTQENCDQEVI